MEKITFMGEFQYVGKYFMNNDNTKEYDGYKIINLSSSYKYSKNLI